MGGPPCRGPSGAQRDQRHRDAAGQQPGREQQARPPEQDRADQDRRGAGESGGDWWCEAANEQVLGRVDVADEPGQQVSGPECGQAGRCQRLELAPDRDPGRGEHAERDVVGREPLAVAEDAASDAEPADRDHGDGQGSDVRVLGGPGQQES